MRGQKRQGSSRGLLPEGHVREVSGMQEVRKAQYLPSGCGERGRNLQELGARPCAGGLTLSIKSRKSKDWHEGIHTLPAFSIHAHTTFQKGWRILSLSRDVPRDRADHPSNNMSGLPLACQKPCLISYGTCRQRRLGVHKEREHF